MVSGVYREPKCKSNNHTVIQIYKNKSIDTEILGTNFIVILRQNVAIILQIINTFFVRSYRENSTEERKKSLAVFYDPQLFKQVITDP